jgi:hypothetical protein
MNFSHSKKVKPLAAAVAGVVAGMGLVRQASAFPQDPNAIDVLISRSSDGDNLGSSTNQGVVPQTYTPSLTGVPYAPAAVYDAADTNDGGTLWNTLLSPPSALAANTSGLPVTVTFQQNLPLADSEGNSNGAKLNVFFVLPNNKSDGIHNAGVTSLGTGSDELTANPTELMSQSWFANSTSETIIFQLTGLTPNLGYNLYMYGGGANGGFAGSANGGSFSLAPSNQGYGYGGGTGWFSTAGLSGQGAYITVPNNSSYYSVFSASGGNDPTPERGLSWVLLPAVSDANGNLSVFVQMDNPSLSKGYVNGFQLQPLVPEPATLGLLGAAAAGLMARRRKEE